MQSSILFWYAARPLHEGAGSRVIDMEWVGAIQLSSDFRRCKSWI